MNAHTDVSGTCQINLVSWNVKSLNHPVKRRKVLSHLKELNADIAFLQETHLNTSDHFRLRGGWVGQIFHSIFQSKSRGTAILIKKTIPFVMSKVDADSAGRYIIVVGRLNNTPVVLANVYAPNWDDSAFFTSLFSRIPDIDTHHVILGGDINCVLSPSLDRSSPKTMQPTRSTVVLNQLLKTYGMTDVWRFQNPGRRGYSFYSPVHKTYSRIDYFFVDNSLLSRVSKCEYQAIVISDHAPLLITLNLPSTSSGYRPWRFNTLLLSDTEFVKFISKEIHEFLEHNRTPGVSHCLIWETLKAYLRGQIISYSARVKKKQQERLKKIESDILRIDGVLSYSPSVDLFKERLALKTEFNLLSTKLIENLLNKSRHKSYEHGEKIGKILAHQLRQQSVDQSILEIIDKHDKKLTDPLEINNRFMEYYSQLYTSESSRNEVLFDSFFSKFTLPSIDEQYASDLERPFSKAEILKAITTMQSGKSPGPDGFPSEFFKKFSSELSPILLAVYEESFISGSLPETMRQAVISLIHKKGKSKLDCSSYRPISLLNVDSKIFAKILACRLEIVIPSIVSDDQTGFIKNRYSFYNIRRLLNILHYPTPPDIPEVILSLDAEKAFDRVEWDYLFYTLKKFGFGAKFISWINVLYSSPVAAIRTNNNISSFFQLGRGTRQGCPLSPSLFALMIEPLAVAIRSDNTIKGILRDESEHKVSLYADDTLLYVSEPLKTLPHLLSLLGSFGKISGYKINMQKSELMPINTAARLITFNSLPFKLSKDKFKYLGIWVTNNYKNLYKTNFIPLIDSIKQDFERWGTLPLSLGGRISTVKMNILPRFLYLFQCIPIFLTKSFFLLIDRLISTFIWNGKNARIRKSVLQRHREHGGLSLPNFQYYYWAANARSMLYWFNSHASGPKWLSLENLSCHPASLHALLCSTLPSPHPIYKYSLNPVVKHSFKIWGQFRRHFSLNDVSVFTPIVRNHMFTPSIIDDSFGDWSVNGIRVLKDMYIDGTFATFQQMKTKFQIPNTHFFKYLQLRSFAASSVSHFPSLPPESLLDTVLKVNSYSKGAIGKIYSVMNTHNMGPLAHVKRLWEEELSIRISEDVWESIMKKIHSSSICQRHRVIQFKVVHRLHWSKVKLAKFKSDIDPHCDRCEAEPGTLSHMFWLCPKLEVFWKSIFKFISDTLGTVIEPDAMISIFGIVPQHFHLNQNNKSLIAFTTLLARRQILLKWKDKYPPTFKMWLIDLLYNLTMEKIRYTTAGCAYKFFDIWQPVLDQIRKVDPSLLSISEE
jgi:exonuclease III